MALQLILWVSLFCVTISKAVDYSDIQGLDAACYPRDTCNRNWKTFPNASCECDSSCHAYNDCCFDAPEPTNRNTVRRKVGYICLPYNRYEGVYVIGKCSRSWNGHPTVRSRCENGDFSDPLLSVPTTDKKTSITYRNRYCAECNNINPNNLSTWSPTLTCDSLNTINSEYSNITQDFIFHNIARVGDEWGVYHWNESRSRMSFYPCDISFAVPPNSQQFVRRLCAPDVVSTCASNWKRDRVRQQCESYLAVVFVNGQAYRNVHCLLCNSVSLRSIQCLPPGVDSRGSPPLSFTLLIDVNPRDGNMVGMTNSCPTGQKYDPFFNKCRALVCALPGHVLRNGRCVRN